MQWITLLAPAWLAGSLLALLSAPLGCLVLWRRLAFFADALAHGSLFGVALAALLHQPTWQGMVLVNLIVVIALWWLNDNRLPSDAMLAAVSATLLSLGLVIINFLPNLRGSLFSFLFGDLLAIGWQQTAMIAGLVAFGLGVVGYIWQPQIQLAAHEGLAKTDGINATKQRLFFMGLLAGFTALSLQAVGTLLVTALLIFPALCARLMAHSPKHMLIIALVLAQLAIAAGIWLSVWLNIATGFAIVLCLSGYFFGLLIYQKINHLTKS